MPERSRCEDPNLPVSYLCELCHQAKFCMFFSQLNTYIHLPESEVEGQNWF